MQGSQQLFHPDIVGWRQGLFEEEHTEPGQFDGDRGQVDSAPGAVGIHGKLRSRAFPDEPNRPQIRVGIGFDFDSRKALKFPGLLFQLGGIGNADCAEARYRMRRGSDREFRDADPVAPGEPIPERKIKGALGRAGGRQRRPDPVPRTLDVLRRVDPKARNERGGALQPALDVCGRLAIECVGRGLAEAADSFSGNFHKNIVHLAFGRPADAEDFAGMHCANRGSQYF